MTRIAFISDIHSNIDALEAALAHIDKTGADMTLCLGDIVGYGPCPAECLHEIQKREIQCVMGNHDEYVTLLMDPRVEKLRPDIRQVVEWTQMQLSMDDLKWLSKLPMRMEADEFSILHSSFAPARWSYCLDERTFLINFMHQECQLAFCGHISPQEKRFLYGDCAGDAPGSPGARDGCGGRRGLLRDERRNARN